VCLHRKSSLLHEKIPITWLFDRKNREFGAFLLVRWWLVSLESDGHGGIIMILRNTHKVALVLAFVSAVASFAQTNHSTAFTGVWKLNRAKSTFNPGPGPKSVTVTNAPDGIFTAESVEAQGESIKWSHAWSGGAEVPIDGLENATMLSKVKGHTLDETMRIGGKTVETVHAVVSQNGKTMTTTINATKDHPGGVMHNLLILEKQ
jgi:hypothetical protein